MADSERIPVAANVLGTIGTVFWCVQLIPQIWHNWKHKKTDGLPGSMMFLWAVCSVPFGVYMILQDVNIPLQIQPQLFGFFAFVSWGQIIYYNHDYSKLKSTALVLVSLLVCGGLEAMFIFTLRIPYGKGITWPALLFGIIAAIMLAVGFIPPYIEIWQRRGRVIGINWVFLCVDSLGALFSLFALAAQGTFDVLGGILYIVVFLAEVFIFGSHIIWRFRHRKLLQTAKSSGKTVDELLEEAEPVNQRPVSRSEGLEDPEKGLQCEVDEGPPPVQVIEDGTQQPPNAENHPSPKEVDNSSTREDEGKW
ncbi:PQ loop repeat-domain-containing protein [Talaromyces proteolyticus]|uniref:PQ loop repeat-domain-containing protein n=1 Tax=Talaromyces proteolyticus TaxID=1131652 RepID=A0AAD4L0D7_9EURO|nr:PQ loop repeat-domain-containing protein [Talaromyces proteolyticus]KAH8701801.1 PQ loop repeat-domain-containing protein [Talaromyces proteolyticus]